MKKNKEKIVVNLELTYGSDFQKEYFNGMLKVVIQTLTNSFISHHKDNKIELEVERDVRTT